MIAARRLRRLRHDARADHRPVDAVQGARAASGTRACIGCNQGCIGHYHAGMPIACTINPWTGFERRLPAPAAGHAQGGTWSIVGAGPAGAAAAAAPGARAAGGRASRRSDGPGGQMRLATAAPGTPRSPRAGRHARGLAGGLRRALRHRRHADDGARRARARPGDRRHRRRAARRRAGRDGPQMVHAWDVLAGAETGERVVVADWGGDWTGLAVAEVLADRGCERAAGRIGAPRSERRSTSTSATSTWSGSTWRASSSSTTCGRWRGGRRADRAQRLLRAGGAAWTASDTVVAQRGPLGRRQRCSRRSRIAASTSSGWATPSGRARSRRRSARAPRRPWTRCPRPTRSTDRPPPRPRVF